MSDMDMELNTAITTDESGIFSYSASTSASESDALCSFECSTPKSVLQTAVDNHSNVLHELDKLRGELKRASKSEQWYKQELHLEKTIRLEALKRIYDREQNFLEANQRLQKDYDRLIIKYNKLEHELQLQKEKAIEQFKLSAHKHHSPDKNLSREQIFEIEQLNAIINDQQKLIKLLREQKQQLLQDINSITKRADENILKLQRTLAVLEYENSTITAKCKQLIIEKAKLAEEVEIKESLLTYATCHNQQIHTEYEQLNETLNALQTNINLEQTDESAGSGSELEHNADISNELSNANKLICSLESELITLNERYASVCLLCEQTKLQIDLLQIEKNKFEFIEKADKDEISILKSKLQTYMEQTEMLSSRINELETEIDQVMLERKSLKNRNHSLEAACLKNAQAKENEHRVNFIRHQIEEQNKKILMLNQQQSDWEELLQAVNALQLIEINTKKELQLKQAELEDLNAIFFEQNTYLEQLQQLYTIEHTARVEALQLINQYESQISEMQIDYSNTQQEMNKLHNYVKNVEKENQQLQQHLSTCGMMSERLHRAVNENNMAGDICRNKTDMSKTYYHALSGDSLWAPHKEEISNTSNFVTNPKLIGSAGNFKDVKPICTESVIKTQTLAVPDYTSDFHLNAKPCNLIDDNKELLQKSAKISGRLPTSAILDLIEQSDRNVPSLKKLEEQLAKLCHDVQLAAALMTRLHNSRISHGAQYHMNEKSLMDELKEAI